MDIFSKESITKFFASIQYQQIIKVVIILLVGFLLLRLIKLLLTKSVFSRAKRQTRMIGMKLINYAGFLILIVIVLSELGISLTALLGAAGILGIALGVASQKSLGNIISGFFIITEKSFEIGDVITVGDKTGVVSSVELLSVMLRTFDNLLIRIPNETMISTDIINITRFPIRRMDILLSVAYRSDLEQVLAILQAIGRDNPFCLNEPAPFRMVNAFGDSGITVKFGVWFDKTQYIETRNSIMIDIHERFREQGVEIPFPQVTVHYPVPMAADAETPG